MSQKQRTNKTVFITVVDSQTASRAGSQWCHGVVAALDRVKPLSRRRLKFQSFINFALSKYQSPL